MSARVAKQALAAAEIIRKRGHCHAVLQDSRGRVCLIGAVAIMADPNAVPDYHVAEQCGDLVAALREELTKYQDPGLGYFDKWGPLYRWNDEYADYRGYLHGADDAIELLQRVAAKAAL